MEVHGQSTEPRIQIPLKHEFVLQWNEPSLAYFPDLDSCLSGYTLFATVYTKRSKNLKFHVMITVYVLTPVV